MKTTKILTVINEAINREHAEINAKLLKIMTSTRKLSNSDEDLLAQCRIKRTVIPSSKDRVFVGANGVELRVMHFSGGDFSLIGTHSNTPFGLDNYDPNLTKIDFYTLFTRTGIADRKQPGSKPSNLIRTNHIGYDRTKHDEPSAYYGDKLRTTQDDLHEFTRRSTSTSWADGIRNERRSRIGRKISERTGFSITEDPTTGRHKVIKTNK